MLIMYNNICISEEHKGTKYVIQINYEMNKNTKNLSKKTSFLYMYIGHAAN